MSELQELLDRIGKSAVVRGNEVIAKDGEKLRSHIPELVRISALGSGATQGWARYVIRAVSLNQGIIPSSIHELYMARGRGDVPQTFTVPAINLRVLSFDAARAVFRVARQLEAGAFIFEIARSEMGYTSQKPAEYATNILAAALAEQWKGPVFLQGDHFQVSPKKYAADPDAELRTVKELASEAIAAGFYNIDVDTSTLVEIEKPTVQAQQQRNVELSAELTLHIREFEPEEVTVSIGGEIGEVGGHNSTQEELRVFMDGFRSIFKKRAPGKAGLSKISIQTGTSHGGTVLPNGALATVNIDFDTLRNLSRVARSEYGLGGAVQHGASTLPQEAFHKFVEHEAVEVHLATSFMTKFYENAPEALRQEMYAWLDKNAASDRKAGMTDEQFYYKARKNAIGPFKQQLYDLGVEAREKISSAWEAQFAELFGLLGVAHTQRYVEEHTRPIAVAPDPGFYTGTETGMELADDLQD